MDAPAMARNGAIKKSSRCWRRLGQRVVVASAGCGLGSIVMMSRGSRRPAQDVCATYYDEHVPESSVGKSRKIKGDADLFLIPLPLLAFLGRPLVCNVYSNPSRPTTLLLPFLIAKRTTTDHRMSNRLKFRLGLRPVYIVPPFIRQPDRTGNARAARRDRRSRAASPDSTSATAPPCAPSRHAGGCVPRTLDRQQMRVFLNRKGFEAP